MEENSYYQNPTGGEFSLCQRVQQRLPDLIEGYLDAITAEAIRAHISVCYMCARLFGEMEHTIKLVETLPFVDPGRDFAPSIMAAIQQHMGEESKKPWWRWRPNIPNFPNRRE